MLFQLDSRDFFTYIGLYPIIAPENVFLYYIYDIDFACSLIYLLNSRVAVA